MAPKKLCSSSHWANLPPKTRVFSPYDRLYSRFVQLPIKPFLPADQSKFAFGANFAYYLNFRLEVPTMEGQFELPLGYSSELECQVLEMPFSQKRVSMFLLMPDDPVEGLSRLEANISTENIKMLFSTLKVSLSLITVCCNVPLNVIYL